MPPEAVDVAVAHRARYEAMWARLSRRETRLAQAVMARLEKDLRRARPGSWTAAQAAATLAQIATAVRGLSSSQMSLLRRALPGIARQAQQDLVVYLTALDQAFLGATRPIAWDTLAWIRGYSRPLMRTRLRVFERSFSRYGAETVSAIEDAIAQTLILGQPWTEAREGVLEATKSVVKGKQWMVDRIVRTESAVAYNSTTMAALLEEDEAEDPMLKKLVAFFDPVTGRDSRILHGQTVRVRELFTDVVHGREFDAPPNRPNDREILVGWRKSWGDGREFDRETRNAEGDVDGKPVEKIMSEGAQL